MADVYRAETQVGFLLSLSPVRGEFGVVRGVVRNLTPIRSSTPLPRHRLTRFS